MTHHGLAGASEGSIGHHGGAPIVAIDGKGHTKPGVGGGVEGGLDGGAPPVGVKVHAPRLFEERKSPHVPARVPFGWRTKKARPAPLLDDHPQSICVCVCVAVQSMLPPGIEQLTLTPLCVHATLPSVEV